MDSGPAAAVSSSLRLQPAARIRGRVHVPGDKSISHRALVLAAIAEGTSTIRGRAAGGGQDSQAAPLLALGDAIPDIRTETEVFLADLRGLRSPRPCLARAHPRP